MPGVHHRACLLYVRRPIEKPSLVPSFLTPTLHRHHPLKERIASGAIDGISPSEGKDTAEEITRFLIDLYLLTDKLLDPVTANLVIDGLIHFLDFQWIPLESVVIHIYAPTEDGSPLRSLVRDIHIHDLDGEWASDAQAEGVPYKFLQDFIVETGLLQEENRDLKIGEAFETFAVDRQAGHYRQVIKQK